MNLLRVPILLLLIATSAGHAAEEDPLALASLLLSDGNWDRAALVLSDLDLTARGLDIGRYHALSGLIALQKRDHPTATSHFQAAIDTSTEETPDPTLYLYLSRSQLLGGEPAGAIRTLDAGGEVIAGIPSAWLVRARASRELGDLAGAFDAYSEGVTRFPQQRDFPRQQLLLLVEMGLTREAGERATAMLSEAGAAPEDALAVAEALRRSGALHRAATVLEAARLRFPESPDVPIQQAVVAMTANQPLTAARFLQVAAEHDPALALKS
ncbi:MAG: putative Zn-dependent protease, partial [Myxococcota bacterium]